MKNPAVRRLLGLLRLTLCLAALVFLYFNVSWHDKITLADGKTKVRLLEEREGEFVVLRDGVEEVLSLDDVHRVEVEGQSIPQIQYGIAGVVSNADFGTALLAVLLFLPVPFLSGVRLVWMLGVQDVRLSYWNAIKLTFAGNFFNFALPGTTGGDLIKAYYVTRFTHHKTEAVTTIFLDRVVGLLGLMSLASVMFVYAWNRLTWDTTYRNSMALTLALIWGGLALGAIVVFSSRLRHLVRLPELVERLPGGHQLLRIGRATVKMRYHKSNLIASLAITVVLQLCVVISAYVMSRALHMSGGFELYFICVPIGFLIAAVPISPPQAFGVMEAAYIIFFAQGGLNPRSAAVAFALANRLIQLVWAVPGVLVPLLGAHLPSQEDLADLDRDAEDEAKPTSAVAGN
ncbi:MAG: UPF0104 family protein [Planctomycetota bacterium]|nr:MAG: UPF0104 family protein [Planctomycetota bacterium]